MVCHAFEAFSRDCILLELEMISFLPIIAVFLDSFFIVTELSHLLKMFLRFYTHF